MSSIFFIVGPTASGKSGAAFQAALSSRATIINVDSVQCYEGVEIGSAQPTGEQQAQVPHRLFGYVKPPDKMTAGKYRVDANAVLEELGGSTPVYLVGGSGFYFDALEYGMFKSPPVPESIKAEVEQQLSLNGLQSLFQKLEALDPKYAKKIGPNDTYRISRGLQVMLTTGRSITAIEGEFKSQRQSLIRPVKLGLYPEREALRERIENRLTQMLEAGLDQEVANLLKRNLEGWWPLKSVGLKETVAFLANEISDQERRELIVKNSMALAKRQMTWFRRDKTIEWFKDSDQLVQRLLDYA